MYSIMVLRAMRLLFETESGATVTESVWVNGLRIIKICRRRQYAYDETAVSPADSGWSDVKWGGKRD